MSSNEENVQPEKIELKVNVKSIPITLTFELSDKTNFDNQCPKWKNQNQISIEDVNDLNKICQFFNSIINGFHEHQVDFSDDAFAKLSVQSGYWSQIMEYHKQLLPEQRDLSKIESNLAVNYPEVLNNLASIDIIEHQRILSNALNNGNFPYSKFAEFIVNNVERNPDIIILLSQFCISDFDENDINSLSQINNVFSYFNHSDLLSMYQKNKQLQSENERLKEENQRLKEDLNQQNNNILSNLKNLDDTIKQNHCNFIENTSKIKQQLTDIQGSQNEILSHVDYVDKFPHQKLNQFNGILNKLKQINSIEIRHGAEIP